MTPPEENREEETQNDRLSVQGSSENDSKESDHDAVPANGEPVSKDEMKALSRDDAPPGEMFPRAGQGDDIPPRADLPASENASAADHQQPREKTPAEDTEEAHKVADKAVLQLEKADETLPPENEEVPAQEGGVEKSESPILEPERAGVVPEVSKTPAGAETFERRFLDRLPIPSRKVTVSVAAGLLAAIFVAGWLTTHGTRQPGDLAELGEPKSPLDRAKSFIQEKKYGAARDVLKQFLNETPESAERSEGLFLLAETIHALEQQQPTKTGYAEARETYKKAIDSNPSSPHVPDALRAIARTYVAEQMYKESRDALEEVVRKYPTLPDIAAVELDIANTYLMQKDSSGAAQKLADLIADYPGSDVVPRAKLSLGTALEIDRQYDKAVKLYKELMSSFPGSELSAQAQERLADLESARGNYAAATDLYRKRAEMPVAVTGNDRVLLKLAGTYASQGKWKECATTCRTILELFKKSDVEPDVIIQLCRAEQQNGHIEAALQYALEGRNKFPENAELTMKLADLYSAKANYPEAAKLYDEATELAPDDPQAWFGAGVAHLEAGEVDASTKDFREVIERFSSDACAYDAYLKLADILARQGDPQQAIDVLKTQLSEHVVSGRRDPILSKIAGLYLDLGLPGLAAETYGKMLDGVDDDEVLARMGMAYLKAERWDAGFKTLETVNRTRVSADLAYNMLVEMGVTFRSFGNLARAAQSLEAAMSGYPNQRDERGVISLLRTYLVADRVTDAMKLTKETETWAYGHPDRKATLALTKLIWGDYLFASGDHTNAAEQFSEIAAQEDIPTPIREWATYQKGNCYLKLARYTESVEAYKQFLNTYPSSVWKKAAQLRLDFAKLEMRLKEQAL